MPTTPILAEFVRFFDRKSDFVTSMLWLVKISRLFSFPVLVSVKLLESDPNRRDSLCFCMNMCNEKRLSDAEWASILFSQCQWPWWQIRHQRKQKWNIIKSSYPNTLLCSRVFTSRREARHAFCNVCSADISVAHRGKGDLQKHIKLKKHEELSKICLSWIIPFRSLPLAFMLLLYILLGYFAWEIVCSKCYFL